MTYWAKPPQDRSQLVLFSERLGDAISADHPVRLLEEILGRLDWTAWESTYHGRLGQPPIHPRVLASVLLYGLLKRIRSSRSLEEALEVRLDFRWLAEGRSIDHTTLSEFRRRHSEALQDLFVQVALVARQLDLLPLTQLAYDGTRLRANNRRSSSRTPAALRALRVKLGEHYRELERELEEADRREDPSRPRVALSAELKDAAQRLLRVDAALAELERIEESGETVPSRLPLTDPQSRMTPNKEGGFAPNYTPLATVDATSGLIVASDVIAMTDEEHYLVDQLEQVQEDFGLEHLPGEVLADGMMASGDNLITLEERGVTLYSPAPSRAPEQNPALRDDPTRPVDQQQWDKLPAERGKQGTLTKEAFVYDPERDCYWCPLGQPLTRRNTTSERTKSGRRAKRTRYRAATSTCAACPLVSRCMKAKRAQEKGREISRYDHDPHKERLAERMAGDEARQKYARRREVGERPFAVIKQHFGARRFLLRGLDQVRTEWRWLATAFNLQCLMRILRSRAGPAPAPAT
jgi:transposase